MTPHGTRKTYRLGCTCTQCRAANAKAQAQRRADRRAGRWTLGLRISPSEALKRIRQLKAERVSQYLMAKQLGLHDTHLRVHPDAITVRKLLKIRKIYRFYMGEGPDLPGAAA